MGMIRTIVERLSRGRVLKRRIHVQDKSISLLVSPDAQLKYLKPGAKVFDGDLIDIAENYLSSTSHVWDIGANVGVFTFAASIVASKGTVVAVEADIWLASILRKTTHFKEYADKNICIIPAAISNKNSVASFMIASRGRASNALEVAGGRSEMGGVREIQYVPTLTLDRLLESFPPPNFVKIDVEGAELMAVEGAKKLINEIRPTFYIEVGQDVSTKIFNIFCDANYQAFDQQGKQLQSSCSDNTFFIPQENTTSS